MKDAMKHNNYISYLNEVIKICTECTENRCYEDISSGTGTVCPRFKEERKKIQEKYYGKDK